MKHHSLLTILAATAVIFPSVSYSQPNSDVPRNLDRVGRFQLFQGTSTALDGKNNRADKEVAIFLIDTATGKVYKYVAGLDSSGNYFEGWQPTGK